MAAYWSTLAYQSLFEPSRFFGRKRRRAPSITASAPSFWARCGPRTSPARSPKGRARNCSRYWPSSPTKCGRCPWARPAGGRGLMPRKAKPTPDEACALHLRDLRREHGRPPADVARPNPSDSPARC